MDYHKSDKCIKCDKLVYNTLNHMVCSQCSNSLHLRSSRPNKKTIWVTNKKLYTILVNFVPVINP